MLYTIVLCILYIYNYGGISMYVLIYAYIHVCTIVGMYRDVETTFIMFRFLLANKLVCLKMGYTLKVANLSTKLVETYRFHD